MNPTRGPFHFRAPSHIFYRALRGMIKHKSSKGKAALARLQVFEGMPAPFDKMKKKYITNSLRVSNNNFIYILQVHKFWPSNIFKF